MIIHKFSPHPMYASALHVEETELTIKICIQMNNVKKRRQTLPHHLKSIAIHQWRSQEGQWGEGARHHQLQV